MGVLGGLRRIVRWRLWKGLAFVLMFMINSFFSFKMTDLA